MSSRQKAIDLLDEYVRHLFASGDNLSNQRQDDLEKLILDSLEDYINLESYKKRSIIPWYKRIFS